jgi:hypothetical protein
MADWPFISLPTLGTIHIFSLESLGVGLLTVASCNINSLADSTAGLSNITRYIPFYLSQSILVAKMFVYNGTVVDGNIDLGIYDMSGRKLMSTGSVVQSGSSVLQVLDITGPRIGPGNFYMALGNSSNTAKFYHISMSSEQNNWLLGVLDEQTFPLPDQATFTPMGICYTPFIGLSIRVVV